MKKASTLLIVLSFMLITFFQYSICADTYDVNVSIYGYTETDLTLWCSDDAVNFIGETHSLAGTIDKFKWCYKLPPNPQYYDVDQPYGYPLPISALIPGDIEASVIEVKYDGSEDYVPVTSNTAVVHIISPIVTITKSPASNYYATGSSVSFEITPNPDYEFQGYKYKIDDGIETVIDVNNFTMSNITKGTHNIVVTAFKYNDVWEPLPNDNSYINNKTTITVIDPTDIDINIDNYDLAYGENATITLSGDDTFNDDFNTQPYKNLTLAYGKVGTELATTSISSLSTDIKAILGSNYSSGSWIIKALNASAYNIFPPSNNYYIFVNDSVTFTISDPVEYTMIEKPSACINKNNGQDAVFVSSADFSKFSSVKIDGQVINSSNYSAELGSTKITLYASYLSTLTDGLHTISIESNDGFAEATFTLISTSPSPAPDPTPNPGSGSSEYVSPKTGIEGTANNHSLLKVSSLSLLAIGTYIVIKKRKEDK